MNVLDHLKNNTVEEIKEFYTENSIDASAAMMHICGDFNLGSLIRSANFYGFKETIYVGGGKSFDRRSTVGTHNYIPTKHLKTEEEFVNYTCGKYSLICIENNIPLFSNKTISLFENDVFKNLTNPPIFLFGEEQRGISEQMLTVCERIITIPSYGTVRSLNVGCCASTIFSFYRKYHESNDLPPFSGISIYL